jgi:hypothetical protein
MPSFYRAAHRSGRQWVNSERRARPDAERSFHAA